MALGLGSLDGRSSDRLALGRGNGEWEGCAG
jgi:hypothetical protein